jgi:hypothetical protein
MSSFGNLYEQPDIYLVDGVVKEKTILEIGYNIESAFEYVGDIVGNIHGTGMETASHSRYVNALSTSIGDMSKVSQDEPFGVTLGAYLQNFVNDNSRKDFILDLVPTIVGPSSVTINAPLDSVIWNLKSDITALIAEGDYCITGRVITFFLAPTGAFSVAYAGNYPLFSSERSGYMPNVYPDPELIAEGLVDKPVLTRRPSGRIRISINQSNRNSSGDMFGSNLELEFNNLIAPFVSSIGQTPCPQEYISAWKKDGNTYTKLNCRDIFIISNTVIEIDTDELIDDQMDVLVFAISNITLADMAKDIYKLLKTHNHDKEDVTSTIDHSGLTNLIPVSDYSDITYGGSNITGNDHPQYLHREGYKIDDTGTYGNALLGDLLISSTDDTSLFNNVLGDSNRLIFGSTTEGISVRYRSTEEDLFLYSPKNGLTIKSNTGLLKQGVGLTIDDHEIYDYNSDFLSLQGNTGKVRIAGVLPDTLGHIEADNIDSETGSIKDLSIKAGGEIAFPDIKMEDVSGDVLITATSGKQLLIAADTVITDVEIDTGSINTQMVTGSDKIIFGSSESSHMKATDLEDQAEFISTNPFRFSSTGHKTGISFGSQAPYGNMYSASPSGGESTPSDHNMFLETNNSDIHIIKSTSEDQIEDGTNHKWKAGTPEERVDDLRQWPHANISAGKGQFSNLEVDTSSLAERKGLSFGSFNNIYVTGSGTDCPSGWMVLESQNGVVLINSSSDPIDCSTLSYSDFSAGDIQSFGSMIAEDDLSAGGNARISGKIYGEELEITSDAEINGDARIAGELILESKLSALGEATFNTNVDIKGSIEIGNSVQAGNLTVIGLSTFNEVATMNSNLNVEGILSVEGRADFRDRVSIDNNLTVTAISSGPIVATSIQATDVINALAGIESGSDLSVRGSIDVDNAVRAQGNLSSDSNIIGQGLEISRNANVSGDTTLEGSVIMKGEVLIGGQVSRLSVNAQSAFSGETTFNGNVNVFGGTIFGGEVEVNATLNAKSALKVEGVGTFSSQVDVQSKLTSSELEVSGNTELNGNVTIKELLQAEAILANGILTVNDDILGAKVKSSTGFEASIDTQSSMFSLSVGGALTQSNSDELISFAGEASFAKGITVAGLTQFQAGLTLGSANPIEIIDNQITVGPEENRGTIRAGEVYASKITGSESDLQLSQEVYIAMGQEAIALVDKKFLNLDNTQFEQAAIFNGPAVFTQKQYVSEIVRLDQSDGFDWIDIIAREAYYAA